jgi:hypothetical protein
VHQFFLFVVAFNTFCVFIVVIVAFFLIFVILVFFLIFVILFFFWFGF